MKSFPQGIHPPQMKDQTQSVAIKRFDFAPYYILLLNQQIGKPAIPVVKEGQEVLRGEKIADADGDFSSPIHSPVTGKVVKLGLSLDLNGAMVPSIITAPYPASSQIPQVLNPSNPLDCTQEELIQKIKNIGMVGLGGAAFPTHLKLKSSIKKGVKTLVINGCECEPYLTADHRIMLEKPEQIIQGVRILLKGLNAEKAIIAIEDNKADCLPVLRKFITATDKITVEILQTKYPQGAEKTLIKSLFDLEVPSGGLPADLGIMVANITTLFELGALLPLNQGIIERVVTITGDGVKKPGNYLLPIGTPLEFILEKLEVNHRHPQVIFGGPMMGKPVTCTQTATTKGVTGILILKGKTQQATSPPLACIGCGECVALCPLYLNPYEMVKLAQNSRLRELRDKYHLFDCFECGNCSWVCPSKIELTQSFKTAKSQIQNLKLHPLKTA